MNALVQHIKNPGLVSDNTLHVVVPVVNSARWQSRIGLARMFIARMLATPNVRLYIVEAAYGDRHHEVTADHEPSHLQLRTSGNIWVKESMINLGVRLLPRDWKYMAWVDGDVEFRNPNWATETLHQLQHFQILQPWQNCADLGPNGEVMQTHTSFGFLHQAGLAKSTGATKDPAYKYAHTGYAWACTRGFWERVGGLPDFALLGAGDHHSAWACINEVKRTIPPKVSASYSRRLYEWQEKAYAACHGEVGFATGRIEHAWHGKKANRKYHSRWDVLIGAGYDPDRDLYHDEQGLVQVHNKALDYAVHRYNVERAEDATTND